jgi:tetratricopeptide (TPR) repeat protein
MTVSGDTKCLKLPDLLQHFEANLRSCTLTLKTETGQAHLYVREGKIAALVADGRPPLADLLATWRVVSQRALDDARRKRSRRSVVELLIQNEALAPTKLRAAAEAALSEDVTNLVAAGAESFELSDAEEPPELFDADELALELAVPVSATLLEAARRSDTWLMIRKSIPTDTATFVGRDGVELPPDLEEPELAAKLLAALDGGRNVKEAVDLFPHCRLLAYSYLARFVRDRLARPAAAEDLATVAESLEQQDPQRARRVVGRGLEVEPHHLHLLELEGRLAKRLKEPKAAAAALKVMAHVFLEAGDTARTREALDQARLLDPADAAVRERILALDLDEGRFAEAVQDGMKLVALYRAPGLHAKAKEVLARLVEADPKSLQLRLELARSLVDSGVPEEAVEGLLRHGKKLVSWENYVDAHQVYEELLTIAPTHKEARRSLEMIDQQIFKHRRERRRRVQRLTLAVLALFALGRLAWREVAAQVDLATTMSAVSKAELIEGRRYDEAIQSYRELAERHPFTWTERYCVTRRIEDLQAKPGAPEEAAEAKKVKRGKGK